MGIVAGPLVTTFPVSMLPTLTTVASTLTTSPLKPPIAKGPMTTTVTFARFLPTLRLTVSGSLSITVRSLQGFPLLGPLSSSTALALPKVEPKIVLIPATALKPVTPKMGATAGLRVLWIPIRLLKLEILFMMTSRLAPVQVP